MSDEETRQARAQKFKKQRNLAAKKMFENKGAFALKVHSPKKQEYKREKLYARDLPDNDD